MKAEIFQKSGDPRTYSLLRPQSDNFGIVELDLVAPPQRFWDDDPRAAPPLLDIAVDSRRTTRLATPTEVHMQLSEGDNWMAMTRRSLGRLAAWFLVCEDRQARLRAQPVATLAHQASLVSHVLSQPNLNRVLIADEVGLGKTVEAGLIIKNLIDTKPGLRVLYLAPARLVRNVRREFDRLNLPFRQWVSGDDQDATLRDQCIVASIHRAVHQAHSQKVLATPIWDVIIVDECHHLSDWEPGGGKPVRQYKLVQDLLEGQHPDTRLILMSGTPHQGHPARFQNLLALLKAKGEPDTALAGRVIYRTKDDVRDWDGNPLFPKRQVNPPQVIDLGAAHRAWLEHIHDFYVPPFDPLRQGGRRRAAGWRCAQALQWATSSVHAGLGYLVRQAIRLQWDLNRFQLTEAIKAIRPYRLGPENEPVDVIFRRIQKEVARQLDAGDVEDIEEVEADEEAWQPDHELLAALLDEGVRILRDSGDEKWRLIYDRILKPAGDDKVVLFAQPIETVTVLARFLERETGRSPALIIGDQSENARQAEIENFWRPNGPQFLVSSRAGGEGINLQVARHLIHVDVPWNPMELEQRVGRVHRFGSRQKIIVDTVVAKDSREVDMYRVAREKLHDIASTLVPSDRFEHLFERVMSLLPPEELQSILGERPLAPLTDDEQSRIANLVSHGFSLWRDFHDRYSDQRIQTLSPGEATWEDLAAFVSGLSGAKLETGRALRFRYEADEVTDASMDATVVRLKDGTAYGCGDFAGMPITDADGQQLKLLGLNLPFVASALREAAFPTQSSGAAQVRWPDGRALPRGVATRPFAVWIAAEQSLGLSQGAALELGTSLHVRILIDDGKEIVVEGKEKGDLLRGLLAATIRREPELADNLISGVLERERNWYSDLRHPSDSDREQRIAHAVTPLLTAIVS